MRDPNDARFEKITTLMANGQFIGADRPVGRATWQKLAVTPVQAGRPGTGTVRYLTNPGQEFTALEMSFKTCDINRSIDQDAATCTVTLDNIWWSTVPQDGVDTEANPGYLTPGHGDPLPNNLTSIYKDSMDPLSPIADPTGGFVTHWQTQKNMYRDAFIPNTVIRTYQGYGSDNFDLLNDEPVWVHDPASAGYVHPSRDSQLYLTGTWLVDKVTFTAGNSSTSGGASDEDASSGTITIEMRDISKLLIEQYIYPDMIPLSRFPLIYCPAHGDLGHREIIGRNVAVYDSSSVDPWYGHNAKVYGHRGSDAFDSRPDTYWLSVGNALPDAYYSFEWIQAKTHGSVNEVQLDCYAGHYTVYVSVMENGVWQGTQTVPYTPQPPAFPNGANIHYVASTTVGSDGKLTIRLPRAYNAQYVRVAFTNLFDSGLGPYHNRAGVRTMVCRYHQGSTFIPSDINQPGKITDWSEPIKELCAWAGFTWPDATPNPPDPLLGRSKAGKPLRVWGDFENFGAGPIVCTPADYFISKSFMEGIRQIADFMGAIFFVDESGGAICRMPNIWSSGNFITDPQAGQGVKARINSHPIELHENANLVTYQLVLDDTNVRSEILVVGGYPSVNQSAPVAGGYVLGHNSATHQTSAIDFTNVLAGQNRLMVLPGDATKFIYTERECQRMAELTALFILFSYRRGQLSAPAHPGLQLDDQIRIFERVTYETNIHYVSAISTHMDLSTGEYSMNVTTHWLGNDPNTNWFVNKAQLTPAVLELPAVLAQLGKTAAGDTFEQAPYGS